MRPALHLILVLTVLPQPAAGQGLRFENMTAHMGLSVQGRGMGVAVRDYDRDGWPDLFVAADGQSALFRNLGGTGFERVTGAAGLALSGNHSAAAWADVDNDGLADLAVVGPGKDNRLFRGLPGGTFEDITDLSGIDRTAEAVSLAWGDFDGDGLVDLFLPVDRAPDLLYRNLGGGRFQDVSGQGAVLGPPPSVAMQAMWYDFDHDGRQDLFVVHDGDTKSRLHRNRGYLPLVDEAPAMGFADVGVGNSMGMAWADVDGDGWEDVYITRIGDAGLYRNLEGQGFEMMADALGAWRNGMSWGAVFADFDNDLDPDLFVVNTTGFDGTPTLLYENQNGWFYDRSQSAGASFRTETQGLAMLDYDRDGSMDVVFPGHDGTIRFLRGAPPAPGNWLRLALRGTRSNADAIGARVVVRVGSRTVTGFVSGGDSFCSQSEPLVHVGLGGAASADRITVYWGGGATDDFEDLGAGVTHLLVEGSTTAGTVATASPVDLPVQKATLEVYPNPVLADTAVRLGLPEAGPVRVVLVDLLGRTRAVLHEGWMPAGSTTVGLGAEPLAPGTYFVVLETKSTVIASGLTRIR